jgi:hypothetical protein
MNHQQWAGLVRLNQPPKAVDAHSRAQKHLKVVAKFPILAFSNWNDESKNWYDAA